MNNTKVEKNTNVTTKVNQPKRDLYREVREKIMDLLEQGVAPWRQTWSSYGLARNYVSGKTYNGINKILMNNTIHSIPYFMSFKQVKALKGKIKKGAKADHAYYFSIYGIFKYEYDRTCTVPSTARSVASHYSFFRILTQRDEWSTRRNRRQKHCPDEAEAHR